MRLCAGHFSGTLVVTNGRPSPVPRFVFPSINVLSHNFEKWRRRSGRYCDNHELCQKQFLVVMACIRLIHIETQDSFSLTNHLFEQAPPYAILSHTWGVDDEEVIFEDMQDDAWKQKAAHVKLRFCADRVQKDGLDHFWIDTCCINKADQRELQEAITSMYRWYAESEKCYVLLSDVSTRKRDAPGVDETQSLDLHSAKWFTRGWTLQELLAPSRVEFYSRDGNFLGDKRSLGQEIHAITNIDERALGCTPLSAFSVRQRMSWASNRKTKLPEDQAYCLAGLFGVFLLPNYGEGPYAFRRLKREIGEAFRTEVDEIAEPWSASHPRSPGDAIARLGPNARREKHREAFMSALSFEQMGSRQSTIQVADESTCEWFLTHSTYTDWLESTFTANNCRFLWLFGKPGAGKSTLMKFALARAEKTKLQEDIIISFFFNARGDQLERSVTGMFRALVFQLFDQAPDLQDILDDFNRRSLTAAILQKIFLAATNRLGNRHLRCFIDALDECPEHQIQQMISFLEEIGIDATENTEAKLYVCFASRHYPTIYVQYGSQMILENQPGHGDDITKYVQKHLHAGKGKAADEIKTQFQQKANGVFLWVVLVTAILNDEYRRGNLFRVKTRLQELPPELGALFREILCRDEVDKEHLLLALQWILFAAEPLTIKAYYFAMVAGLDPDPIATCWYDEEALTTDDMARFVHSSSKGLAEVTESKVPTVQLIHESVRDYLIKENGMGHLWPDLGPNLRSLCHDKLKWCCNKQLQSRDYQSLLSTEDYSFGTRYALEIRFPFLGYAAQFVFYHAEEAYSTMTSQGEFLESFDLKKWIRLSRIYKRDENASYTRNASLVYILAENNCPQLIQTLPPRMPTSGDREQYHHYPIFAAFARGHRDSVRALLFQVESRPSGGEAAPNMI